MSPMFAFKGLNENFMFLVVRIRRQLEDTLGVLELGEKTLPDRMRAREDYIDNLKITIERKSYRKILRSRSEDDRVIRMMGSLNTAVSNLEEIGDYLINIVTQVQYLSDPAFMGRFDYQAYFRVIEEALDLIVPSLFKGIVQDALAVCRAEIELDRLYKRDFDALMAILREGRDIGNAVTALMILRYLERIGDSLLNIGEAIISAYAGSRLKLFEYLALQDHLPAAGGKFTIEDIHAETRSGCRIEKVVSPDIPKGVQEVIFKEGELGKIEQEREKLGRWQEIMPGLTPKVFGFQPLNGKAFMLLECIDGLNFQEIVIKQNGALFRQAFRELKGVMDAVWTRTKLPEGKPANFMRQLLGKLPEVYEVHSSFNRPTQTIGSLERPPFVDRLKQAARIEAALTPPFSVFIHGDFNADNILYNHRENRIYYIDLHRSHDLDYVQDVSVFMISNFRMPLFNPGMRHWLSEVIDAFYCFAREFSERHGDETFDARLALGLIRSLISSTRFILKEDFSKDLFLRGIYLLDRLLEHEGRPWEQFRVPRDIWVY